MKPQYFIVATTIILILLGLNSCQSAEPVQAENDLEITVAALETQVNAKITDPPTATLALIATDTVFPTATPTLEPTEIPSLTPISELINTPTLVSPSCTDIAELEKHLSVGDGSILKKLTFYAKVWRIKNIGTCTWTPQYKLVFTGANFIIEQPDAQMPTEVAPGQSVELKVDFVTPSVGDTYVASWLLENPTGARFGVGLNSDQPIGLNFVIPVDPGVRKSC